jgi:hypothetical protein
MGYSKNLKVYYFAVRDGVAVLHQLIRSHGTIPQLQLAFETLWGIVFHTCPDRAPGWISPARSGVPSPASFFWKVDQNCAHLFHWGVDDVFDVRIARL